MEISNLFNQYISVLFNRYMPMIRLAQFILIFSIIFYFIGNDDVWAGNEKYLKITTSNNIFYSWLILGMRFALSFLIAYIIIWLVL